ncbi:MAG: molybdate ABC transporter substrate-binding protein [Janthinobacterium lividum]
MRVGMASGRVRAGLAGAALLAAAWPGAARAESPVVVFAAASLTDAMGDVARAWVGQGHPKPVLSFGSSAALARQVEAGAPAQLFASADERWMDDLAQHGALLEGSRRDVLGNRLVLVEPRATAAPVAIAADGFAAVLAGVLGAGGRLAVGDPASVPAGIYAEEALRRLGAWDTVSGRLARSDSVRSALLLVERGEAPAGIVYGTDAAVSPGVVVAGVFPEASHAPITYPFAALKSAGGEAMALLAFMEGPEGAALFRARGFSAP